MRILIATFFILPFIISSNSYSMSKKMKNNQFKFENYKTADKARAEYRVKKFPDGIIRFTNEDYLKIDELRIKEQYKKDAMTDLLKLHPIGSDIKDLQATLEKAGASRYYITNPKYKEKYKDNVYYEYRESEIFGLVSTRWRVHIKPQVDDSNKIGILFIGAGVK